MAALGGLPPPTPPPLPTTPPPPLPPDVGAGGAAAPAGGPAGPGTAGTGAPVDGVPGTPTPPAPPPMPPISIKISDKDKSLPPGKLLQKTLLERNAYLRYDTDLSLRENPGHVKTIKLLDGKGKDWKENPPLESYTTHEGKTYVKIPVTYEVTVEYSDQFPPAGEEGPPNRRKETILIKQDWYTTVPFPDELGGPEEEQFRHDIEGHFFNIETHMHLLQKATTITGMSTDQAKKLMSKVYHFAPMQIRDNAYTFRHRKKPLSSWKKVRILFNPDYKRQEKLSHVSYSANPNVKKPALRTAAGAYEVGDAKKRVSHPSHQLRMRPSIAGDKSHAMFHRFLREKNVESLQTQMQGLGDPDKTKIFTALQNHSDDLLDQLSFVSETVDTASVTYTGAPLGENPPFEEIFTHYGDKTSIERARMILSNKNFVERKLTEKDALIPPDKKDAPLQERIKIVKDALEGQLEGPPPATGVTKTTLESDIATLSRPCTMDIRSLQTIYNLYDQTIEAAKKDLQALKALGQQVDPEKETKLENLKTKFLPAFKRWLGIPSLKPTPPPLPTPANPPPPKTPAPLMPPPPFHAPPPPFHAPPPPFQAPPPTPLPPPPPPPPPTTQAPPPPPQQPTTQAPPQPLQEPTAPLPKNPVAQKDRPTSAILDEPRPTSKKHDDPMPATGEPLISQAEQEEAPTEPPGDLFNPESAQLDPQQSSQKEPEAAVKQTATAEKAAAQGERLSQEALKVATPAAPVSGERPVSTPDPDIETKWGNERPFSFPETKILRPSSSS